MEMTETALDALAPYNKVRATLEEFKAKNAELTFDYTNIPGIKAAKSHIHKLRGVKGEIERIRKDAKAGALDYGRKVDGAAKELTTEVEGMISVHEGPLLEMEAREDARKQRHTLNVAALQMPLEIIGDAATCRAIIKRISDVVVDASWEEFKSGGLATQAETLKTLNARLAVLVKQEEEAAELERLRQEKAERDRADREAKIAADAAAKSKRETEDAAMAEAKRKEAETQKALAEERAKTAAAERAAADAEAKRAEAAAKVEREAKAKADADAKRAADKAHRAGVLGEVIRGLMEINGVDSTMASFIAGAIADGKVPHVTINF